LAVKIFQISREAGLLLHVHLPQCCYGGQAGSGVWRLP
jgi:hypothetical protein